MNPRWVGPALILARQVLGRNLFLMNLVSGMIMKKSYRNVRPYLHPTYYNLTLEMRNSLQAAYPLCLAHGAQDPNLVNPQGLHGMKDNFDLSRTLFTGVLRNILTIFSYIRDSLPQPGPSDPVTYYLDEPQDGPSAPPHQNSDNQGTSDDYRHCPRLRR